jgi:hypothetical protein
MKISSPKAINWTLKQYGYSVDVFSGALKGDTDANILDGVKIVQEIKQLSIENKAENQNKYFSEEQF